MTTTNSGQLTYEAMAPVYDQFTAGYQASRWTGKLEELALAQGVAGRRLLDVGCGTGKSFIPMLERGWEVVGCDVSPAMLAVAREKVPKEVTLAEADARELPVFGSFDLVWALNDTLNYLLGPGELEAALRGMRENLAPGGVLLFDLNALLTFRTSFSTAVDETREEDGKTMTWTGQGAEDMEPGSIGEARLEVEGAPGTAHVHYQRHYPEAEALEAIERAGLECLGVWGDFEGEQTQPLDESKHQKAIYLARQPISAGGP